MTAKQKLALVVLSLLRDILRIKQPKLLTLLFKKATFEDNNLFSKSIDAFYSIQASNTLESTKKLIQIAFLINKIMTDEHLNESCLKFMSDWISKLEKNVDPASPPTTKLEAQTGKASSIWREGQLSFFPLDTWYPPFAYCYRLLTDDLSDDFISIFDNAFRVQHFALTLSDFDEIRNLPINTISLLYQQIEYIAEICKIADMKADTVLKQQKAFALSVFTKAQILFPLLKKNAAENKGLCTLDYFKALSPKKQRELLNYADAYHALSPRIHLNEFLALPDLKRHLFIQYYKNAALMLSRGFVFLELLSFTLEESKELLEFPNESLALKKCGFPIKTLFSDRIAPVRLEVFNHAVQVAELYKSGITIDYLSLLPENVRWEFYRNASTIAFMLRESSIPLRSIIGLNLEQRNEFYSYAKAIVPLYNAGLSLNILSLPIEQKQEIFKETDAISFLVEHAGLSLTTLFTYSAEERNIIYKHYETLAILIKDNCISLDTFVKKPENLELDLARNISKLDESYKLPTLSREEFIEKHKAAAKLCFGCNLSYKKWKSGYSEEAHQPFLTKRGMRKTPILVRAGISMERLFEMDNESLTLLLRFSKKISAFVKAGINIDDLLRQKNNLEIILPEKETILFLLSDGSVCFNDLFKPTIQTAWPIIIENILSIKKLIGKNMPVREFLAEVDKLNFIVENIAALTHIIGTKQFTLAEFLNLNSLVQTMLLSQLTKTLTLIAHDSKHHFAKAINAISSADLTVNLFSFSLPLQITLLKYHANAVDLLQKYRKEAKSPTQAGLYATSGFKDLLGKLHQTSPEMIFSCLEDKDNIIKTKSFTEIEEYYRKQISEPLPNSQANLN